MRLAIITAGAAGMYCGSCLKDNTLAAALSARGHDCVLIPTYTPLTLDEPDESTAPIYLGGVNVVLDEYRITRWLPSFARRWLDSPGILRFATRFAGAGDYAKLGGLTISMLRGEGGRQRRHVAQLADHLANELRPDVVVLSNVLLSGLVPAIQRRCDVPVLATLQGDDLFLESLTANDRAAAIDQIQKNYTAIAATIATSRAYADRIAVYLGIPREQIHVVRPGIRVENYSPAERTDTRLTIGYFARITPEKGLHRLVEALAGSKLPPFRLRISGWLGPNQRPYLQRCLADFHAHCGEHAEFVPCPTLAEKVRFLQSLDIFSVPAVYHEPKGIYVLEAMASGVPVVQPNHGAFPELLEMTGGGLLVDSDNAEALTSGLERLADDGELRRRLGEQGRKGVREHFSAEVMARETELVLNQFVSQTP